jgi:hypothetical protein
MYTQSCMKKIFNKTFANLSFHIYQKKNPGPIKNEVEIQRLKFAVDESPLY